MFFIFFFFSSRRRHTRFKCDWSSDVCSSDLIPVDMRPFGQHPHIIIAPAGHRLARRKRSEEHTSELQSHLNLVCRLLLEKKKKSANRMMISNSVVTTFRTPPS